MAGLYLYYTDSSPSHNNPMKQMLLVISLTRKMRFRDSRRFIQNHTTEKNSPGFCLEAGAFAKSTLRQLYENYHIKM